MLVLPRRHGTNCVGPMTFPTHFLSRLAPKKVSTCYLPVNRSKPNKRNQSLKRNLGSERKSHTLPNISSQTDLNSRNAGEPNCQKTIPRPHHPLARVSPERSRGSKQAGGTQWTNKHRFLQQQQQHHPDHTGVSWFDAIHYIPMLG